MEYEIDLRRYFTLIVKRWRWIVSAALIAGLTAAIVAQLRSPTYTATASILLRQVQSEVKLDPRFVTNDSTDAAARQQGLLALAKSTAIETRLSSETVKSVALAGYVPGDLTQRIDVTASGDLITIAATASVPEKARALADAWATSFVDYVNGLQAGVDPRSDGVDQERKASDHYAAAQQAYEQFLGTSPLFELQQNITTTLSLITETQRAALTRYSEYLKSGQQLEVVLRDATALRSEIAGGHQVGAGEKLAALLLRARASGGDHLPIQLQVGQTDVAGNAVEPDLPGLDTFIKSLQAQIADLHSAAARSSASLAENPAVSGGSIASEKHPGYFAQLQRLRQKYEAEEGKRRLLQQQRDVALESLQVVRRKIAEAQVATAWPNAEVRLASKASLPERPSKRHTLLLAAAGACAGALVGLIGVLIWEIGGLASRETGRADSITRPANSPSST